MNEEKRPMPGSHDTQRSADGTYPTPRPGGPAHERTGNWYKGPDGQPYPASALKIAEQDGVKGWMFPGGFVAEKDLEEYQSPPPGGVGAYKKNESDEEV